MPGNRSRLDEEPDHDRVRDREPPVRDPPYRDIDGRQCAANRAEPQVRRESCRPPESYGDHCFDTERDNRRSSVQARAIDAANRTKGLPPTYPVALQISDEIRMIL